MRVLLCVGEDADALLPDLATAWREAAPACEVTTAVLPGAGPAAVGQAAPVGVFVPLDALGLASVASPGAGPLDAAAEAADLVVVHLGALDGTTLREGLVAAAVRAAAPLALPVVVLAGRSEVSRREWSGAGVSGVHETGPDVLAAVPRVARTWAPSWA
ncbi:MULTISPECIES: glycerate kinase [unclassified Isoptericola]|uniref:glycerate kinase n=1 Tax=unclassified Isoptericola TaxID=2623355 RepID=UPI00365475C7